MVQQGRRPQAESGDDLVEQAEMGAEEPAEHHAHDNLANDEG